MKYYVTALSGKLVFLFGDEAGPEKYKKYKVEVTQEDMIKIIFTEDPLKKGTALKTEIWT